MKTEKWKPLHLFLYHKNDDVTYDNYKQLCLMEGKKNVQPISDCQSFLPKTFRADLGKLLLPHWDSYWMCDGLIYKYILMNTDRVLKSSAICISEWDTWWQIKSKGWMEDLLLNCDIAASNILEYGRDEWIFFEKHKDLSFSAELRGLVPFSAICIKPKIAIKIAERVRDDTTFHPMYNNEMRIGTVANMIGAKMAKLPIAIGKNVQWAGCKLSEAPGVYHPIKSTLTKSDNDMSNKDKNKYISNNKYKKDKNSFAVITGAFYGDSRSCFEASRRLRASVDRFGRELIVVDGPPSKTLQEMKNHLIVPVLEKMNHKWVMWLDCSDVFCAMDPYLSIEYVKKCGKEILVSAEGNCWPEPVLAAKFPKSPYIFNGIDYKYLNSGVWVGERLSLIRHLKIIQQMYIDDVSLMEPWRTDQATWHRLFIDQSKYNASIALDYRCDLVVSTANVPMNNFKLSSGDNQERRVKIIPTGGKPIILHFNGNDKHDAGKINTLISMSDQTGYEEKMKLSFSDIIKPLNNKRIIVNAKTENDNKLIIVNTETENDNKRIIVNAKTENDNKRKIVKEKTKKDKKRKIVKEKTKKDKKRKIVKEKTKKDNKRIIVNAETKNGNKRIIVNAKTKKEK